MRGMIAMRKDGKLLKDVNPMYTLAPYIMKTRNDSLNFVTVKIPYAPIHDYINASKKKKINISHMAVILAAYVRIVSEFPALNRFVVHSRVYAHNDFKVAMVVLKPGSASEETMAKLDLKLTDTIFEVNDKINSFIADNRKDEEEYSNSLDNLIATLTKMSGFMRFAVNTLMKMDEYGILPKSIIDASPFHTSLTISNLASIRTREIYHHIYNFGTTSMFITMGSLEKQLELVDGVPTEVRYIPMGVSMDERIASGLYISQAFRRFTHYLKDPSLLEQAPEKVTYDSPFKDTGLN